MDNEATKTLKMLHEINCQKNIFSKPKIKTKLSTNFKDWDLWVNKFNNFYDFFLNLGSFETREKKFKFVIIGCEVKLCLKLKM